MDAPGIVVNHFDSCLHSGTLRPSIIVGGLITNREGDPGGHSAVLLVLGVGFLS